MGNELVTASDTASESVPAVPVDLDALGAAAAHLLAKGVPANTSRAYGGDRKAWREFCRAVGAPVLPVDPDVLGLYVTHLLTVGSPAVKAERRRPLSPSTVERHLASVSTMSVEAKYGRPDTRTARVILRGRRRTGGERRTRQAAPATVPALRAMVAEAMSRTDADGRPTLRALRDRVVLLVGFAIAGRRSELTTLRWCDIRSDPDGRGLIVDVYRAKTAKHRGEERSPVHIPYATDPGLCPVRAVRAYRAVLVEAGVTITSDTPVVVRVTRADTPVVRAITGTSVATIIRETAAAAGVEVPDGFSGWSGHSLRRGFATAARAAGHDQTTITRQGGWVDGSREVGKYIVDADGFGDRNALRGVL